MAQINLSGSISTTGTAILGTAAVVFATDANHTLSVAEYTNYFLEVTSSGSLTTQRNLIAPLVQGQSFVVQNKTTGGQSIQIIGSSGTGIIVPNGLIVAVVCDGTNYQETSGGAAGSITFQPGGTTYSNVFTTQSALQSAITSLFGPVTVYLDFSTNSDSFSLTSNLTFNSNTSLSGVVNQANGIYPVIQTAGHALSGITQISNADITVSLANATTPIYTLVISGESSITSADGYYYFDASSAVVPVIYMADYATIGDGTHPVFHIGSTNTIYIGMLDGSTLSANSFSITSGGSLNISIYSPGVSVDSSFYTLTGVTITDFTKLAGDVTGTSGHNTVGQRKSFLLMGG